MPYFVVYAIDNPGMDEVRVEKRPAHRDRLRNPDHPVTVHVGGPLVNEEGEMFGSMLIIEADDRQTVANFVAGDPYVLAGLYETCEIYEFNWGLGQPK